MLFRDMISAKWANRDFILIHQTFTWGKQPASNQVWIFGLTNSPLSTAKFLIDAMFA